MSTTNAIARPRRPRATSLIAAAAVVVLGVSGLGAPAASAVEPVGLGTATSFAVLAGSGITNTGPTTITGDIGTFPTPSETGLQSVTLTGVDHAGDAVTQGAKDDLTTAYLDAAGRGPVTSVQVELGGRTLLPGVYRSPTLGLTGTLTLDAGGDPDALFVFQTGSTLITATQSRVLLINEASPCNVVWQIGSSATFGTGTRFVGDVLAHTSITATTGATFIGRLLARDGAVTLDTNTITRSSCAAPAVEGGGTTTTTATTSTPTTTTPSPPTTTPTPTTGATGIDDLPAFVPSAAPGSPTASPVATPASPTAGPGSPSAGTPTAGPGSPSGGTPTAPGAPAGPRTPSTPSTPNAPRSPSSPGAPGTPPWLARTGAEIDQVLTVSGALLLLGLVTSVFGRRWAIGTPTR